MALRKGVLVQNSRARNGGVSARCWKSGAFGFASIDADDDQSISQVLHDAGENAALIGKSGAVILPTTPMGLGSFDHRTTRPVVAHGERLERLREIDAYIVRHCPELITRDLSMSFLAMEKALQTSEGASTYSYVPRTTLFVRLSVASHDGTVELGRSLGGFGEFEDQFCTIEVVFPVLDELYEAVRRKASGVRPMAGLHDVVLAPSVAGILAHEAIGHTCEADVVLGGSVAGEYLGQQVAADKFTLIDSGGRGPEGKSSLAIEVDDEGTPCRDITLIESGVLKGFLHNKETAMAMEMEPTGNARAHQYSDEPLVRMRNTSIAGGTDRLDEMIASIEYGYYLQRSSNGEADATSEFMFGIVEGREIRNGKLGRSILDTTISGVAFDMLKTITHVGDEVYWTPSGWCGKKQLIPVGIGGPAIKCQLTMGGR